MLRARLRGLLRPPLPLVAVGMVVPVLVPVSKRVFHDEELLRACQTPADVSLFPFWGPGIKCPAGASG